MSNYEDGPDDDEGSCDDKGTRFLRVTLAITREVKADGQMVHTATHESDADAEIVAAVVNDAVRKAIGELIDDALRTKVHGMIDTEVKRVVGPRLEKMLDDGWPTYSEYGGKGKTVTLADLVAGHLKLSTDRYGGGTVLQQIATEKIGKLLDTAFKAELDAATKGFRKQVDELLGGKIAGGLREAFGLKS